MKQAREYLKLTQGEFAKKIGISRSHVSNIENSNEQPSQSLLMLIDALTPIRMEWLKEGSEPMTYSTEDINKPLLNFVKEIQYDYKVMASCVEQENFIELLEQTRSLAIGHSINSNAEATIILIQIITLLNEIIESDDKNHLRECRNKIINLIEDIVELKNV